MVGECPEQAQRWLYRNIVLIGGCTKTPNFRERVEREVRELAPDTFKVSWRLLSETTQVTGRKSRNLEYCIFNFNMTLFPRPAVLQVTVHQPSDPVGYAWQGGAAIAKDDCLEEISVSRADYLERGHEATTDKFFL